MRGFAVRAVMLLVPATQLGVAACEPVGVIGIDDATAPPPADASVEGSAIPDAGGDIPGEDVPDVGDDRGRILADEGIPDVSIEEPVDDGGAHDGPPTDDASPLCSGDDPPVCLVGATRWCSNAEGEWGTQRCTSIAGSATWGHCATAATAPSDCTPGDFYDENCCVQSGGCCAHAVDGINYGSIGACGAIDPCNSCDQLCVRGAIRWCDFLDDVPDASGQYAWGQQACDEDGTWGACTGVQVAPASCDPLYFDDDCCADAGACCQVFDSFGESASASCPTTSCDEMWAGAGDPTGP